jgi:hypothetical protein
MVHLLVNVWNTEDVTISDIAEEAALTTLLVTADTSTPSSSGLKYVLAEATQLVREAGRGGGKDWRRKASCCFLPRMWGGGRG